MGDQPLNAMYIADKHKLGYEIFNLRSGLGTRPIRRKNDWAPPCTVEALRAEFEEVLEKALGEDGEMMRKNVLEMKEKIEASWAENGEGWKEVGKFFEVIGEAS